jgi:RNA polymerase sigma-70 factor, ECF subfamily
LSQTAVISPVQTEGFDSPDPLARARAGDGESFWLLCEPLKDRVLRQAFALCRDEVQAQDLAQETFFEAWKSLRRFNGQCQFATWLCSILLHRHKSALRRARWRTFIPFIADAEQQRAIEGVRDGTPAPDQAADLSERSRLILQTLDRLPGRQREVIFLRFYADESLAGIAAAMNCSIGTAKSRLFHGLESLRRMNMFRKEFR